MKQKEIVCKVCGKVFLSHIWNAQICSDECRRAMQIKQNRERRAEERERLRQERLNQPIIDNRTKQVEKLKSTMAQLTIDAIEAHKRGMSYGKYIAYEKGTK